MKGLQLLYIWYYKGGFMFLHNFKLFFPFFCDSSYAYYG